MLESYLDFFGAAAPYRCAFHAGSGVPEGLTLLPYHELWAGGLPKERAAAMLWRDDAALHVVALMEDSDVRTEAVGKNDQTWVKGDVMELFFQAAGKRNYIELHLAPNLATLELAFPSVDELGKGKFEDKFFDSGFKTASGPLPASSPAKGWWGKMDIPLERIGGVAGLAGARFSVCRYNYNQGWEKPEISSCSRYPSGGFHQPQFWNTMKR